ncbi:MAG: hypothetical protein LBV26_01135 [Bacteroidales bacterium]|nr:hypothetical protein [Bacteroidales bacterium]
MLHCVRKDEHDIEVLFSEEIYLTTAILDRDWNASEVIDTRTGYGKLKKFI